MNKLELDNFLLEEYDESNVEHKSLVIELDNEHSYLGDVLYRIESIKEQYSEQPMEFNHCYIVYYNDYPIGLITISKLLNDYEICYGILPKYRKQYLASLLLQEFSYKMLDDFNYELSLFISSENIGSKKTAELAGYEKVNFLKYKMSK